jgi:DNA-directed RNA polymerase subunit RPC12/RpoP
MSEAREFFRICPACGRRFHIRLVSRELVDEKRETAETKQVTMIPTSGGNSMTSMHPITVEENVPITLDVEEFQYSYKCKHCGHEWFETRTKVSR